MKNLLLLLLCCLSLKVFSQSKLTVVSTGNRAPVANAVVTCNGQTLGVTNSSGILQFKTRCKKVDVAAKGFYTDDVVVDKVMELVLSKVEPKTQSIEAVVIADKSDPAALEILQKVNDNYKNNSPQSLDSYSYKSYEKISLDLDEDSIKSYNTFIEKHLDSLNSLPKNALSKAKKKDSLESIHVMKLMGASKLFLWERASQFMYSRKYGEKITILDNRVSGLKQPIYEMMSLRSNRNRMPREIREENRSLYRFFLTDTLEIDGRKNFVIRFRQTDYKTAPNRRKYNGYLYIDTETYGLKKIESHSKIASEGMITSIWKPIENKWFLSKENLKLKMGSTVFNTDKSGDKTKKKKFGNYVYVVADYFDFHTPVDVDKKDFSGYTMDVKNADGTLLDKFRSDSLTAREKLSYEKIDSVGKKYKLDQRVNAFTGLIRGNLRIGKVDFDALEFIKYNLYEGIRLGAAAKLNERFNAYISPDAYFAYGFKDHTWKYGAGIDVKTTLAKTSVFRAEYYDDVVAAGRFSEILWNFKMSIMNSGIDLHNDRFYGFKGFKLSYENDLSNALTLKISAKKDDEVAKFGYAFRNFGSQFGNFATKLTLKYAPNSKNIMTPSGKYTYDQNYPEYYFNYEQGLKTLGGELSYSRFDLLAQHSFRTEIGTTGIRVYGGMLLGTAPIWHHFAMNGLSNGGDALKFNLTSYLGFATMEGGKYYNDKFFGYYLTHRIPFYYRTFGKRTSSFDVLYRGVSGDMKNPEYHVMDFRKLDHLYQEIGVEANNFLGTPFDLGFFYRIGHYATPNFKENFAIQLKLSFLGF